MRIIAIELLVAYFIVLNFASIGYSEIYNSDRRLIDPACKNCHQSEITHENFTGKDCKKCHMAYDSSHLKNHIKSPSNEGNAKFCPQCHKK